MSTSQSNPENQSASPAAIAPAPLNYESVAARPTWARYGVLLFCCSLAILLYVDRVCIGQAAGSIKKDLGLSDGQMSYVYIAFTIAYCLFEAPTGHWGDKYGSRGVITRIAIWWSAFTALTGACAGLWSLVAVRFLFGAGEAGAFPNVSRVLVRWFPAERRGFARGTFVLASMLGGAAAPVLAAYLILHVGWRTMFGLLGILGVIWAGLFYLWFRDDPTEHPSANEAERALIGPPPPLLVGEHAKIPWMRAFTSPNTYLQAATMSVSAILFYMVFQWYPTYLKEARGVGQLNSGWWTGSIILGGAAGCVVGGWLSDFVQARTPERNWSFRLCGGSCILCAAASITAVRYVESVWAVTMCHALALFFVQAAIPTWWAVVARISGGHGAAMWGLMNSMAGFSLMATTNMIGRVVDRGRAPGHSPVESWSIVFTTIGIIMFAGAICWLLTDATRSIVELKDTTEEG